MDTIKKAFAGKTGIEVGYWRGTATKVMDRVLSEHRAGKPLYDVVLTNDNPMQIMYKEGVFAKYDSPAARDFPESAIDAELGVIYRYAIIGVVYNKSVIKPAEAPKSLEDLVQPKYRGKLVILLKNPPNASTRLSMNGKSPMISTAPPFVLRFSKDERRVFQQNQLVMPDPTQDTTTLRWLESLHKVMGKERAEKFVRDLAGTKPILVEALVSAAERATTGEAPIAVTLLINLVTFGQKGAPLDYVRLGTMMGNSHYIVLSKKARHPNAGKAFIDFFLGEESMRIMARNGESVNRKGVYPPIPDIEKFKMIEMEDFDTKGFAEKKRTIRKSFCSKGRRKVGNPFLLDSRCRSAP